MPLKIDYGEIAERLRRFYRQTGRLPLVADASVIPVSVVQDVSQDPWRGEPRTWSGFVTKGAVAAVNGVVGLIAAPKTNTFNGELLVVDSIEMDAQAAASVFRLSIARQQSAAALLIAGFANAGDPVTLNTPATVITGGQVIQSFMFSGNANVAPSFQIWQQASPASQAVGFPGPPIVLFPGDVLFVANQTVNQIVEASFTGRVYDPVYLTR